MNKKTLKLIALILTLATFICIFSLSVAATDEQPPTGLLWDKEFLTYYLNYFGDVNRDNEITIADAKAALRICAKLDECTYSEDADVNMDGKVSIADAKQILRVVAGFDGFKVKVDLKTGEEFITYDMSDEQPCLWTCTVTPEIGLDVEKLVPMETPDYYAPLYNLIFTANEPGTYEAVLKYENSETHKVEKEIIYTFNVE